MCGIMVLMAMHRGKKCGGESGSRDTAQWRAGCKVRWRRGADRPDAEQTGESRGGGAGQAATWAGPRVYTARAARGNSGNWG